MIHRLILIAKTVWLQALRRKDLYVVMILAAIFALWVIVTRIIGIDSAATASFLMSFGLSMSYLLAAIVTAGMAARQFPGEFETRTLYPLLARPISRGEVFLGKALGVCSLSTGILLTLVLISYLPTPRDENQSSGVLLQSLLLQTVGLWLLAFLAMALSLLMPAAVSMLTSLVIFFAGGAAVNFAVVTLGRTHSDLGAAAGRVLALIPDFSIFNQIQRFVDSRPALPPSVFLGGVAYGGAMMLLIYLGAAYRFSRRQI